MMCLRASYKKKYGKNMKKISFFASLKSMKKGVGSGVGSGSISHRYGSGDPDPRQNFTDPEHWSQLPYLGKFTDTKKLSNLNNSLRSGV
jgi:hypothetical protein